MGQYRWSTSCPGKASRRKTTGTQHCGRAMRTPHRATPSSMKSRMGMAMLSRRCASSARMQPPGRSIRNGPDHAPPLFAAVGSNHFNVTNGCLALFAEWKKAGKPAEIHVYDQAHAGFAMSKRVYRWIRGLIACTTQAPHSLKVGATSRCRCRTPQPPRVP